MLTAPFYLNLRHLRAILAIVESGSVSAASKQINLSQPAVTQGLVKVEQQIGVKLFHRLSNGMVATKDGEIFVARIRRFFEELSAPCKTLGTTRGFSQPHYLMTNSQLRAFLAMAESESFVQASRAIGLPASSIHRAIRDLEKIVGITLVKRSGRGIVLTSSGRHLARGARLAAMELGAALREMRGEEGTTGNVVVGAMPLCRALVLPATLARFVSKAPLASVEVVEGGWKELIDPLRDGKIDLVLGALREEIPPDLEQEYLFDDELCVVARSGHPLAECTSLELRSLARYPWVIGRSGTPLRLRWEAMFEGSGLSPAVPIECGSVMTISGILSSSEFLTLLSETQVRQQVVSGQLTIIGIHPLGVSRKIGFIQRTGWRPTKTQLLFVNELRSVSQTPDNQRSHRSRSRRVEGHARPVTLKRPRGKEPNQLGE